MDLKVISPSLGLIGSNKTPIHGSIAIEYAAAVMFNILHILLGQFIIIVSFFVQIA